MVTGRALTAQIPMAGGNLRELRHVVEKLIVTTIDGDLITAEAL